MNHQVNFEHEEQFAIHHPKEVVQILNELAKAKSIINISFNRGSDQCLTSVIGVNYDKRAVYLDIGLDDNFNQRLLSSNHLIFSKEDGIRVRWNAQKIERVKLKDGDALKIPLPEYLIRLQRRQFFRCATPVVNPLICHVSYPHPLHPKDQQTLDLTLLDISLGGIGTYVEQLPQTIELCTLLPSCRLHLPDFGDVSLTLSVQNIETITLLNGAKRTRVGLQFRNLTPHDERLIQRYVFQLERELLLISKSS